MFYKSGVDQIWSTPVHWSIPIKAEEEYMKHS